MFRGLKFFATGRDDELRSSLSMIESQGGKVINFSESEHVLARSIYATIVGTIGCNASKIAYAVEKGIPIIQSSWVRECIGAGYLLKFDGHEYSKIGASPCALQSSFGLSPSDMDVYRSPRRSYTPQEDPSTNFLSRTDARSRVHPSSRLKALSSQKKREERVPDVYSGTDWASSLRQSGRPSPSKSGKGRDKAGLETRVDGPRRLFPTPWKPAGKASVHDQGSVSPHSSNFTYSNVSVTDSRRPPLVSPQNSCKTPDAGRSDARYDRSYNGLSIFDTIKGPSYTARFKDDDTLEKMDNLAITDLSGGQKKKHEGHSTPKNYTHSRNGRHLDKTSGVKGFTGDNALLGEIVRSHPDAAHLDKDLVDQILQQIVHFNDPSSSSKVSFQDISGLDNCKQAITEAIILPCHRPELFTGLRRPSSAILLFGPPGNGKTMLAQAIACECRTTFFSLAASSLISKFVGDSEKAIKTLFTTAHILAPSILFFDEIDSLLQARGGATEMEGSRRLKTEFLIQVDGVKSKLSENSGPQPSVMVIGATNRPFDLDDAVLRRFAKKIFVPLPVRETRLKIMKDLFLKEPAKTQQKGAVKISLSDREWNQLADKTEGYSSSDLSNLCKEIALVPIRELDISQALRIGESDLREIVYDDAKKCLQLIKPSSSQGLLQKLEEWNADYGST